MLSRAYILPWSVCARSFHTSLHLHFHLTRSLLYCIFLLYRNRLCSQKGPPCSPFLHSSSLQPSFTWIERYEDERIGCTETIAVGERFLALSWTCPCNALQRMGMEPLKGGAGQQIICEYLLAFGSGWLPSERLCEPSMASLSVEHKGNTDTDFCPLFSVWVCKKNWVSTARSVDIRTAAAENAKDVSV